MDTTPTLEMLTSPNSPLNKKAINKQLKFVQSGLRATRCIVAGGAPRDHLDGVAAADLDFYVPNIEGAQSLRRALNILQLDQIWSLETRQINTTTGTPYADGTSERYLQDIYEGVAEDFGGTVKVNIMVLQPQIEVNTRSDLIVQVLKNFPEGTSHHVYTIHGGEVMLLQHDQCTRLRSANSPPEYQEKVLRKLMLRDSPLLGHALRSGHSAWVCEECYGLRGGGNAPVILRLNRGNWNARKITKKGGVGLRDVYTKYQEIRSISYNMNDMNIPMFNQYEEGEITYEQYIQHLQAQAERSREAARALIPPSEQQLRTLRASYGTGRSSVGSLPRDGSSTWSTSSAVQPSRGQDAELVEAQRQERKRLIREILNSGGAVRVTRTDPFTAYYGAIDLRNQDF